MKIKGMKTNEGPHHFFSTKSAHSVGSASLEGVDVVMWVVY
jgi:hypothetical protein